MNFVDLTGQKFHKLYVIGLDHKDGHGIAYWKCQCDCGNIISVRGGNLRSGVVKSCGCLKHESHNAVHHMSNTKLFGVWWSMKNRCNNPKNPAYKNYGERGITVCEDWNNSSSNFFDWAKVNGYEEGLSIERIDVNGNYCPENCKWIPLVDQAKNRRFNYQITYNGKTQDLQDWCNELHLPYKLIHNRIFKLHWDFERAITEDVHTEKQNITRKDDYNG